MSEHAEVKQEHRDLAHEIIPWFLCEKGRVTTHCPSCDRITQLLADHDAEVERKAYKIAHDCVIQTFANAGEGPTEGRVMLAQAAKRIAELGGTNG